MPLITIFELNQTTEQLRDRRKPSAQVLTPSGQPKLPQSRKKKKSKVIDRRKKSLCWFLFQKLEMVNPESERHLCPFYRKVIGSDTVWSKRGTGWGLEISSAQINYSGILGGMFWKSKRPEVTHSTGIYYRSARARFCPTLHLHHLSSPSHQLCKQCWKKINNFLPSESLLVQNGVFETWLLTSQGLFKDTWGCLMHSTASSC